MCPRDENGELVRGKRVKTEVDSKGGADQSHKMRTNIKAIVSQYHKTGTFPHVRESMPLYGDFASSGDLLSMLTRVQAAQGSFDALPSEVRAAARNSPVEFLAMFDTQDGREKLVAAGLEVVPDDADVEPIPVRILDADIKAEDVQRASKQAKEPAAQPANSPEGPE